MKYTVRYRRHYVDYSESFSKIESAWKFIKQMDEDGSGYAAEIREGKKVIWTRYNPTKGWVEGDPRAIYS